MQEPVNPYNPPQTRSLTKALAPETSQEPLKHSGLGIASFVLSLFNGLAIFVMFIAAGILENSTPGGIDEHSPQAMIIGLFILLFMGVTVLAMGLGIGGLCQKNRKKIFAILGTIFSSLTLLGTIGIIVLGLMVSK